MMQNKSSTQYSGAWIALLAFFTSLGPLSIDMYLPALPSMAQDFGVSTQMVANTLPAYFLGLAVGQLIYGPISDRIGRKKPLYFGMTLFTLGSILCFLAPDAWSLIIARILQALGGCVGVVIARAAIRDRLDVQASAQAFASMMIAMGLAPILAPILGAWILQFAGWRSIFLILASIGLACLFCVHFFFKETLSTERRLQLSFGQVFGLYRKILKDKSFRLPMLAGCLLGGALFCYISSSSGVLMDVYHLSQQQFAYVFGGNALGIVLLSSLNKKLANKWSVLTRLKLGGCIQIGGASLLLIAGLMSHAPVFLVLMGMFFAVAGIGFTGPNSMALAMAQQGEHAGTASAIMGSLQFACGLLGGVVLNFLVWGALLNMALLMLAFTATGLWAIFAVVKRLQSPTSVAS